MTANVLPDIDYSKLEELKKRLPDLSDIELSAPKMEDVGKRAERAVDRLLGRRRTPTWPWIAAAIGLIAVIGLLAAWMTWNRRAGWSGPSEMEPDGAARGSELGDDTSFDLGTGAAGLAGTAGATGGAIATETGWDPASSDAGLTAAEASLTTNRESDERA